MKRSEMVFGLLRIFTDACAVLGALLLAYSLRTRNIDLIPGVEILEQAKTLPTPEEFLQTFIIPSLILFLIIAALLKLYLIRVTLSSFRELARIVLSTIVWVGIIMGWFFFVRKQLFYSRAILLHATFFIALFLSVGRTVLTMIQRMLLKRGIGVRTVLSFGTQPLPSTVERHLNIDARYRYLGHIQPTVTEKNSMLPEALTSQHIDLVLQTDPSSSDETNALIDFCRSHHIGYAFLPPVLIDVPHLLSVYRFGSVPVLRFHPTPLDGWGAVYKRTMDIILSLLFLALLTPLNLLIALAIKLDSRGSILYVSRRIGQGGKIPIATLKFRSMVNDADVQKEKLLLQSHRFDGPLFKMKKDPRVTNVGRFLRRFSLDEWPQLLNVLKGDLSLVGPRPHLPEEVAKYTDFQRRVFAVKPGITGLAQISGRSNLPFAEEVRLDLQYIEEWSPWLDIFILWRTIGVVLRGEGAD